MVIRQERQAVRRFLNDPNNKFLCSEVTSWYSGLKLPSTRSILRIKAVLAGFRYKPSKTFHRFSFKCSFPHDFCASEGEVSQVPHISCLWPWRFLFLCWFLCSILLAFFAPVTSSPFIKAHFGLETFHSSSAHMSFQTLEMVFYTSCVFLMSSSVPDTSIPGSHAILFFTASDFTFTPRHIHN